MPAKENQNENNAWIDPLIDEACGRDGTDGSMLSDASWDRLLEAATAESGKHRMFTSFNLLQTIFQFAGGAVVGAALMVLFQGSGKSAVPPASTQRAQSRISELEAVHELPRDKEFYYRISHRNGFLMQLGTVASVLRRESAPEAVLLKSGTMYSNALSCEETCPRLITPHGIVDVAGSMSKIIVTPMGTEISVLDGSVRVSKRGDIDVQVYSGGNGVMVDGTEVHRYSLDSDMITGERDRVRAYLSAVAGTGEAVLRSAEEKRAG